MKGEGGGSICKKINVHYLGEGCWSLQVILLWGGGGKNIPLIATLCLFHYAWPNETITQPINTSWPGNKLDIKFRLFYVVTVTMFNRFVISGRFSDEMLSKLFWDP